MPDYKEMYLKLFRATEKAINELIKAQQDCEELYLNSEELEWKVLPFVKPEEDREKIEDRIKKAAHSGGASCCHQSKYFLISLKKYSAFSICSATSALEITKKSS